MKKFMTLILLVFLAANSSFAGSISNRSFSDCSDMLLNQKFVSASENSTLALRYPEMAREIQFKAIDKGIIGSYWMSKIVAEDKEIHNELLSLQLDTPSKQAAFLSSAESSSFRYKTSHKIIGHINSLFYLDHDIVSADLLDSIIGYTKLSKVEVIKQRSLLRDIFKNEEFYEYFRALVEDLVPQIYFSSELIKEAEQTALELEQEKHLYRPKALAKVRQWTFNAVWNSLGTATLSAWLTYYTFTAMEVFRYAQFADIKLGGSVVLAFIIGGGVNFDWIDEETGDRPKPKLEYRNLPMEEALKHPPVEHTGLSTPLTWSFNKYVILQDKLVNKAINFSRGLLAAGVRKRSAMAFKRNQRLFKAYLQRISPDNEYIEATESDLKIDGKYVQYSNEEQLEDVTQLIARVKDEANFMLKGAPSAQQIAALQGLSESVSLALKGLSQLQSQIDLQKFKPQLLAYAHFGSARESLFKVHTEKLISDLQKTTKQASQQALLSEELLGAINSIAKSAEELRSKSKGSQQNSLEILYNGLAESFKGPLATTATQLLNNIQGASLLSSQILNEVVALQAGSNGHTLKGDKPFIQLSKDLTQKLTAPQETK